MSTLTDDKLCRFDVCVDCASLLANGETPPDLDEAKTEAYLAEVDRHLEGLEGVHLACHEDCEGGFSWSPCGACGSTLGGDRHPAAGWVAA